MLSTIPYGLAVLATGFQLVSALSLDVNSMPSIRQAAATKAYDLMLWYKNNKTDTPAAQVGTLPSPLYWWEAGAVWGGLIDYWAYTEDTSYNPTVNQAMLAQVGPNKNYMPPAYFYCLGNDDQAFWALSALSAVEYSYPNPPAGQPQWLDLAVAVWNTQVARWEMSTCGGGLRWQVFPSNNGYHYKNAISNGAFFQMSARLARFTGNQTYVDWAEKAWNWMTAIGLIDADYYVYDGTDDTVNCTRLSHVAWSYNPAMLIYGTAMLYNHTNGSSIWRDRTTRLLDRSVQTFFSMPNASHVLYEYACETDGTCNNDQYSFKAYMSRWLAKSAMVAQFIYDPVDTLISRSAMAAAQSCVGGASGRTCGQKWYIKGYDGSYGVGQELSALETIQALALLRGDVKKYPLRAKEVVKRPVSTGSTLSVGPASATLEAKSSSVPSVPISSADNHPRVSLQLCLGLLVALGVWQGM